MLWQVRRSRPKAAISLFFEEFLHDALHCGRDQVLKRRATIGGPSGTPHIPHGRPEIPPAKHRTEMKGFRTRT